ncbi:MAG: hypothetical protein NC203_07250 [Firmicutes bacterium]|nr:hypothetical protein [[Eubacterium] siraeum]MCM1488146.1 hypothetical protein [Bacillota bacterium]
MQAIHIISTAPYYAGHPQGVYSMDKFELYSAALSALSWRSFGDEITLVTDKRGREYIEKIGIADIWNSVQDIIPDDLEGINPKMFWAAGKLFALREVNAPVAMIDTDFILWERPNFPENRITAAHRENLNPSVYPSFDYFKFKRSFSLEGMDKNVLPMNTAFLYLPEEDFKQYYVNRSIAFMKSAADTDDYLCYMVFAEQRLLSICAEEKKIGSQVLMDKDELFFPREDFTHLWGAKQVMRSNVGQLHDFCQRARERIRKTFPDYEHLIGKIEAAEWKRTNG